MDLDHVAFRAAFDRVIGRLVKPPYSYPLAPVLAWFTELPNTVEELLGRYVDKDTTPGFISLLVLREMALPVTKARAQDIHVQHQRGKAPFTLFAGDIEVKGNFSYEHSVFVLGDLVVEGLIEDRFEGSPLIVAGNVRCKGMFVGSETRIGGSLEVGELLHLRYTPGGKTLFVERGAKTKLYLHTPKDSKMMSSLAYKLKLEAYPPRADPNLVKLRALLSPYLARKLDSDEPDLTHIARALRDGRPIWR